MLVLGFRFQQWALGKWADQRGDEWRPPQTSSNPERDAKHSRAMPNGKRPLQWDGEWSRDLAFREPFYRLYNCSSQENG